MRDVCVLRVIDVCYRYGTVFDRTITVRNDGVAQAAPVTVDIEATWLTYTLTPWISHTGWSCTDTADEARSHRWRCTRPSLAAGTSSTLVVSHFLVPTLGLSTEVHVDPQVAVLESNDGNNFVSK
jgi:hypothetical protein